MDFYKDTYTIGMRVKRWLIAFFVTILTIISVCGATFFILTNPAIKINGWSVLNPAKIDQIHQTIAIRDIHGNCIADAIYSNNRMYTPLSEIPAHTQDAFISIEDKRFYRHNGVDYVRMFGALKNNLFSGSLKEGASTITQQLIKNTHLSNKKTFSRKFQEIRIAKQLEKKYSKEEILEAYLNILYFGNNIYGIGQAAHMYFGKNVSQLDIAESALLAGIINNPSSYNPLTQTERSVKRRNVVIDRLVQNNKISKAVGEKEKFKGVNIKQVVPDLYAVFIDNVVTEAAKVLDCLPEEVFSLQPTIIVNADTDLYTKIYSSISDILYNTDAKIRILIVDNKSCKVLGDFGNSVTVANVKRQPGSAIKPFVSYAPALEKKLVFPVSIVSDEVVDFDGYKPKNFENKYYGNITVRDSLKYSLNVPAVKLTDMCGISYSKATAERFGISFSCKDNGLAIALGGLNEGITLNMLADAYATLARGGLYTPSRYIDTIYVDDKPIYKKTSLKYQRAVGTDTAYLLTDMLRECAQSGTAKKLHSLVNVAAKTGTVERGKTNSDAYCIAYTPRHTVAVWYGNDSDSSKDLIYGGKQPASLAKKILQITTTGETFKIPESVTKLDIDVKRLYEENTVYLASSTLPKRYKNAYYFAKNNLPKKFSYDSLPFIFNDDFASDDWKNFEIVDSLAE